MSFSFDSHANLISSLVATPPSPPTSGPSLIVSAGDGAIFPAPPFNLIAWPSTSLRPVRGQCEIFRVTGIATDTLTILRAQESTTAQIIATGWFLSLTPTAKCFTDIEAALNSLPITASGSKPLGSGISFGSVTGLGLSFTPTKAFLQIQRPSGGLSITAMINDGTIGSGGFDFELSATTDSASYILDYLLL